MDEKLRGMMKIVFRYMEAIKNESDKYDLDEFDIKQLNDAYSLIFHLKAKLNLK